MTYTIRIHDLDGNMVRIANLDKEVAFTLMTLFANNINLTVRDVTLTIQNDS